ncbi:MAG TPA: VOC family protein [Candidatus Dormibacteraeota bacterium]|jgi:methylmalonyl-CoA/ethylmalonyl-CoA epimerase|nr:VOC family protein [Candidatus Dormibacteraeota bacterium]
MNAVTGLHQVAQHADDLDRAVAFYRDVVGLRHIATFEPPGLAFLDLSGVRLLLERGAQPSTLYLRVADVEAACAALRERGVEIEHEPHVIHQDQEGVFATPGEEEVQAFFRDSEGNLVGLAARRMPRPAEG